jgi:hypothetical protein
MPGVQTNPVLDFRNHIKHVTLDVQQFANDYPLKGKKLVIDQSLKSNYDTHQGLFTEAQLETIDKLFNKAAKNAIGLTPSFPTEAIHRPTKEMGLGYVPMKDRATQIRKEHLAKILSTPRDRGYIAHAHTTRVANI